VKGRGAKKRNHGIGKMPPIITLSGNRFSATKSSVKEALFLGVPGVGRNLKVNYQKHYKRERKGKDEQTGKESATKRFKSGGSGSKKKEIEHKV